ncbi:MAG TPA: carbon monoxide dehydrogenase subunit G [Anaerolineales bacterium]|nr:carbon monoxide dehydrogenase subunit G [Anaerolineales bacterium]HRQ92995.1 carbon monoxide dehydrogenase subunit G [Anaerolineales bacterium]
MNVTGSTTIAAPQEKVFQYLTNPEFVSKCAPGLESLEVIEEGKKFKGTVSIGLGNLKVRFSGDLEFTEIVAPNKATLKAHGAAPGSAVDATAMMLLSDAGDGTTKLDWSADISVLGTIAALASRMMGSVTQKLSGEFFDCAKKQIEAN